MSLNVAKVLGKQSFSLGLLFKNMNNRITWKLLWFDEVVELKLIESITSKSLRIFVDCILLFTINDPKEEYSEFKFDLIGSCFTLSRNPDKNINFELKIESSKNVERSLIDFGFVNPGEIQIKNAEVLRENEKVETDKSILFLQKGQTKEAVTKLSSHFEKKGIFQSSHLAHNEKNTGDGNHSEEYFTSESYSSVSRVDISRDFKYLGPPDLYPEDESPIFEFPDDDKPPKLSTFLSTRPTSEVLQEKKPNMKSIAKNTNEKSTPFDVKGSSKLQDFFKMGTTKSERFASNETPIFLHPNKKGNYYDEDSDSDSESNKDPISKIKQKIPQEEVIDEELSMISNESPATTRSVNIPSSKSIPQNSKSPHLPLGFVNSSADASKFRNETPRSNRDIGQLNNILASKLRSDDLVSPNTDIENMNTVVSLKQPNDNFKTNEKIFEENFEAIQSDSKNQQKISPIVDNITRVTNWIGLTHMHSVENPSLYSNYDEEVINEEFATLLKIGNSLIEKDQKIVEDISDRTSTSFISPEKLFMKKADDVENLECQFFQDLYQSF